MKLAIKGLFFLSLIAADDGMFRINSSNLKETIYSSSMWLSSSPAINPIGNNRLIFQAGISLIKIQDYQELLIYPMLDTGLKITKNLSITCKTYGFKSGKDSPQVLGGGVQYYFGQNDTLNWSFSIQRSDLNGLKHYRLKTITAAFRKWISLKNINMRIGIGSNTFKERSYLEEYDIPNTLEGQTNFIAINMLTPISKFIIGVELYIGTKITNTSIFLPKEIF